MQETRMFDWAKMIEDARMLPKNQLCTHASDATSMWSQNSLSQCGSCATTKKYVSKANALNQINNHSEVNNYTAIQVNVEANPYGLLVLKQYSAMLKKNKNGTDHAVFLRLSCGRQCIPFSTLTLSWFPQLTAYRGNMKTPWALLKSVSINTKRVLPAFVQAEQM